VTFSQSALLALSGSPAVSILVKVTATTALALAGSRLARRRAASHRHLVLASAFGLLMLIPLASIVAPPLVVPVRVRIPSPPENPVVATILSPAAVADVPAPVDASVAPHSIRVTPELLVLCGWLMGALAWLAPLGLVVWETRRIRRTGLPWLEGRALLSSLGRDAGCRQPIDLLLHESVGGPMTCGLKRPAIVLPADAPSWPAEDLRRALVHEIEHIRRRDWATQAVSRAVCACYWFHPLVWIAWRALVLEAERACDDAVLRRSEPTAYADQLVGLARRLSAGSAHAQLAMAGRRDLSARVLAVLDGSQQRGRAGMRWMLFAAATAALLVSTLSPLRLVAQQQTETPVQRFEAASIRPCRAEEAPPGPARGGMGGTNATFSPGRMNVPCATLEQLIYLAYAGSGAWPDNQLVNVVPGGASDTTKVRGGPDWVHSQHTKFAVEATAPGASERNVLLGSMLRTLLEERFHLKIHRDTEEMPMFNMVVAKSGLKLKPMQPGDCDADRDQPFDANRSKPLCGSLTMRGRGPNTVWTWGGFKLEALASRLSGALGRHVVDQTGVSDEFIIRLEFHPDENTPEIKISDERAADTSAPEAASIFTALEQQVGVRLEKTKGPRGFLVIDHVEPLGSNGGR
jgi:uncharacterized protein (TIGR03435 family)